MGIVDTSTTDRDQTIRARKRWWIAIPVGVLLLVLASFSTIQAVEHAKEQRFLELLDADQTTTIGGLPDDQLIVSMHQKCDDVARGLTLDDEMQRSSDLWNEMSGSTDVSLAEYRANTRALYVAAQSVCG